MQVGLYVVSTPIGNLQDMTFRAITTLQQVALVLVEDTRQARKLWDAYDIHTPMCVVNQHTEKSVISRVLASLEAGQPVALTSDAGTPLIHDPGALLVPAVIAAGHRVIPVPGACAAIAALSVSGFEVSQFRFCGFLPVKGSEAEKRLKAEVETTVPLVFYEAPHRLRTTIERMMVVLGATRHVVLARELTKHFETMYRVSLGELHQAILGGEVVVKGEMVIIVAGAEVAQPSQEGVVTVAVEQMVSVLLDQVSVKDAATILSGISGLSQSKAYALCLARKNAR
jgi:16S rRNA (cytidine1402-2'-O)-methyltransferase